MTNPKPFIWVQHPPAEVAAYYTSIFDDSEIISEVPGAGGPMGVTMRIKELELIIFNAGEFVQPNQSFSIFTECSTQEEIDHLWDRLGDGGQHSRCGWLDDRFGVTWQILPDNLIELTGGPDPEAADRALQKMLTMDKLVITELEAAYRGDA